MASSARIEELTRKFEENPRRYFAPLANEYRKAGDLEQAIAICRTHLPQQPGHMSGHVVFGQALFESGQLDESRQVFETALQLDPENLIALRYLGDIALRRGDRHDARTWYHKVLEVDPRNEEIQGLLAEVDGLRTPPSVAATPPVPVTPAEEMPAMRTEVAAGDMPFGDAPLDLPGELPPAVIDAESALIDDAGLVDGFSIPGDVQSREGDATAPPAGGQLAGLEPTEFESTTLVDMVGAAQQPPLTEEQEALLDLPERMEPIGFEPTSAEPVAADTTGMELEREESSLGAQPVGFTPALSFDEEPADAAPFQVGPSESESAPLLPTDLTPAVLDAVADAQDEAAVAFESPSSLDTAPSEAASAEVPGSPDTDEPVATGFVTATMAELYLRQGHREAALDVYRQLATQSPEDERLRARIEELERSGEPSIRSFLSGIASRRPRGEGYEAREAVPATSGEWMAVPEGDSDAGATSAVPVEVMGWRESNDVVSEIPLADAARAGALPSELSPAVLDGMEEIDERSESSPPAAEPTRRAAPFMVDESAVPFDLPRGASGVSSAPATPASPVPAVTSSSHDSIGALFGGATASAEDDAAATTLAEAFAPVPAEPPLAGRPAAPARDELSLDRVFREEDAEQGRAGGFSFDQFFGSRTPHLGNPAVTPGATPPSAPQTPGDRTTPGGSPAAADPDDIDQFNSWLQGLKKR